MGDVYQNRRIGREMTEREREEFTERLKKELCRADRFGRFIEMGEEVSAGVVGGSYKERSEVVMMRKEQWIAIAIGLTAFALAIMNLVLARQNLADGRFHRDSFLEGVEHGSRVVNDLYGGGNPGLQMGEIMIAAEHSRKKAVAERALTDEDRMQRSVRKIERQMNAVGPTLMEIKAQTKPKKDNTEKLLRQILKQTNPGLVRDELATAVSQIIGIMRIEPPEETGDAEEDVGEQTQE
ncbi:MAG: hypothetical protein ACYTEQ_03435 [Planctomycetota bacterium]|jgi:hypothetical protein